MRHTLQNIKTKGEGQCYVDYNLRDKEYQTDLNNLASTWKKEKHLQPQALLKVKFTWKREKKKPLQPVVKFHF